MKHHKSTFARFIFSLAICLTTLIPMNAYSAGTYPVQVNTMLIPPYSLSLSDYSSGFTEKIAITLLNRDLMQPQLKVKLRLTIKCASDLTLRTKSNVWFDPIVLDAGIPTRLTLEEVLPYFLLKNLDVQGYMKGDALPEGLIEFQVEVFEYSSGVSISMNTVSVAHLSLPKPPKLIQPENGKIIPLVDPTNLLFQWAPQYFGNTGAINYEFILKELPANILSIEDAFLSAPIVYQSTHESTSFLYSASEPALQVGKKYAWAVRSILNQDTDPNIRLDNNGYSTINSFDVSELNLPPTGINATVTPEGEIDLKWTPRMNHTKFVVTFSRDDQEPKVWHDIQAIEPNTKISNIAPGYAYVFRVGAYCASIAEPTYSNYSTVKVSQSEETVNPDCGKKPTIEITNRNPIEKLDVDDKIMVGDFPVRLTQVTGGGGTFSGTGIVYIPYLNSNLSVTFSNIGVNTDKYLISGMVSVDIDKNESGLVNLDALDQGGTGGKVVAGVAKVDRVLDFTMPEKLTMQYTPETGTMEFFDGSTSVGSVDIPKNKAAESDFPFTVEDKDGNVYEIQENPEKSSNNDAAPYVAVKLGNQEGPILDGSMSFTSLAQNEGVVTFDNDDTSQYAIDQTQDYYQSVMIIKDKYQLLDGKYQVKWKYIPPGKTEQIIAKLDNKNSIDPTKVKFKTRVGKVYESAFNSENNTYTITLVGGQDADGQELFAIYPSTIPGIWSNLGKLNIISYTPIERSLVLVKTLENDDTEAGEVEDELNQIYNPVGVNWTVSSEQFTYNADGLFEGGSGILSTYLPNMRTLNAAFKADKVAKGLSIDSKTAYLFLVKQAAGSDRDKQGFMPRGMQFGYIEASPTGGGLVGVVAHELGHGVFRLYHTFNANYGDIAVGLKGSTDNLMDYYKGGTDLAKWQWDMIYDPAILNGLFDSNKEAASDIIQAKKLLDWIKANLGQGNAVYNKDDYYDSYSAMDIPLYASDNKQTVKVYAELKGSENVNLYKDNNGIAGVHVTFNLNKDFHNGFYLSFSYSDVSNKETPIILWCYSYTDFEKLLQYLGLEITKKKREVIQSDYIKAISNAQNNCNILDVIYETMPDFVTIPDETLISNLYSLSGCTMSNDKFKYIVGENFDTDEEKAALNILHRIKDMKGLYDFFASKNITTFVPNLKTKIQLELISALSNYLMKSIDVQSPTLLNTYNVSSTNLPQLSYPTNPLFVWDESKYFNTMYKAEILPSGKIRISSKTDAWLIKDYNFLFDLDPFEFVGVDLNNNNKYFPQNKAGDRVILTALQFYWIVSQQSNDIAWTQLVNTIDLSLNVATFTAYGATKTTLQTCTQIAIVATFDFSIRVTIESLGDATFEEAVKNTPINDAIWAGVNSLVENPKMSVPLDCLRGIITNNNGASDAFKTCSVNALIGLINNKLFPSTGKYAELIIQKMKLYPKQTIAELRKWGITDESILFLSKQVLSNAEAAIFETNL